MSFDMILGVALMQGAVFYYNRNLLCVVLDVARSKGNEDNDHCNYNFRHPLKYWLFKNCAGHLENLAIGKLPENSSPSSRFKYSQLIHLL